MMTEKGFVLIFTLVILTGLSVLAFAFLSAVSDEMSTVNAGLLNMRAFYIAEAGHAKARWALTANAQSVGWGESNVSFGGGQYTVTTAYSDAPTNQHVIITSDGYIPDSISPKIRRTVVENNTAFSPAGSESTNFSRNAAVTDSAHQGNNDGSKATDGDQNSKYIGQSMVISWVALDYGSAKTVNKVVVTGSKIDGCIVQYSNDGGFWLAVSNAVGPIPGTRTFTPVSTRYLRIFLSGEKPQVNEFESYGNASSASLGRGSFVTSR